MDLLPSDEQLEIVGVVDDFLTTRFPTSRLRERRAEPSSIDPAVWAECGDLGWFSLGLSEDLGGVGYGLAEEALVFREIGRCLAPGPFVATALGARVAAIAGRSDLAEAIISGVAPIALAEPRDNDVSLGERVSGKFDVFDAPGSAYVLAVDADGASLIDITDIVATSVPSIDPGVRLDRAQLDDVVAVGHVSASNDPIFLRGSVLVAAMLTGIAAATRDMASQYAKDRQQFGRPIGVNQAIKHACADMATRAEAAASQLLFAALSVDEQRGDADFQATSARIVAAQAAVENAAGNVQVHGGIGYTFEHDAHLYVKRAQMFAHMLGDSRRQMAALLGMPGAQ